MNLGRCAAVDTLGQESPQNDAGSCDHPDQKKMFHKVMLTAIDPAWQVSCENGRIGRRRGGALMRQRDHLSAIASGIDAVPVRSTARDGALVVSGPAVRMRLMGLGRRAAADTLGQETPQNDAGSCDHPDQKKMFHKVMLKVTDPVWQVSCAKSGGFVVARQSIRGNFEARLVSVAAIGRSEMAASAAIGQKAPAKSAYIPMDGRTGKVSASTQGDATCSTLPRSHNRAAAEFLSSSVLASPLRRCSPLSLPWGRPRPMTDRTGWPLCNPSRSPRLPASVRRSSRQPFFQASQAVRGGRSNASVFGVFADPTTLPTQTHTPSPEVH